jgi:hypothetical protein
MGPWIWKSSIIVGLGFTFFGLILMIESKVYRKNGKVVGYSPGIEHPIFNTVAWIFTIVGYILQIIGVIIS